VGGLSLVVQWLVSVEVGGGGGRSAVVWSVVCMWYHTLCGQWGGQWGAVVEDGGLKVEARELFVKVRPRNAKSPL
jgi:hypothetical protein